MTPNMKPHEFNLMLLELRKVIELYKDTQQLRAQLVKVLGKHIKVLH